MKNEKYKLTINQIFKNNSTKIKGKNKYYFPKIKGKNHSF